MTFQSVYSAIIFKYESRVPPPILGFRVGLENDRRIKAAKGDWDSKNEYNVGCNIDKKTG